MTITTTLADWGANSGSTATISITIDPITCSCSALAWTAPGSITTATVAINGSITPSIPNPTADTSATSSNAAFSSCYEGGNDCATTGAYASADIKYLDGNSGGAALSGYDWISFDGTTLTISPTATSVVGSHSLMGTFTPTYGTAAQFTVVTFTVECEVTSFTKPANPTTGLTYNLWATALSFDFS